MFSFKYIFFIAFLCPNPTHPSFMWDWSVLDAKWELYLYGMSIINIISLGWFYFLTKPNPTGVKRFILLILSLLIIGAIVSYIYLFKYRDMLFIEGGIWSFEHTLASLLSGLVSELELLFISLLIFLLISLIPMPWHLRAMRRYPFRWIP